MGKFVSVLGIHHDATLILAMRQAEGMPQLMQHQFLHFAITERLEGLWPQ